MTEIACFISPHGFGHATRAIAVIEACRRSRPDFHTHFFTTVPRYLFAQTLTEFTHHPVMVDVGMVQSSALEADIPATICQLDRLLPFDDDLIKDLAARCAQCALVLCDIAPLGIAVAKYAGLPSVLVESFTWDWIYHPYVTRYPGLLPHAQYMANLFSHANYRIQTEPLCAETDRDLYCGPIFRRIKRSKTVLQEQLGCGDKKLVVVSMGGVFQEIPAHQNMAEYPDIYFLLTGQKETKQIGENIALLAQESGVYNPDLLNAADVVVCKAGYSTIAECCQAGARVISVGRDDFAESAPLQRYLEDQLAGIAITSEMYQRGDWIAHSAQFLLRPKPVAFRENGADKVADFLCKLI